MEGDYLKTCISKCITVGRVAGNVKCRLIRCVYPLEIIRLNLCKRAIMAKGYY